MKELAIVRPSNPSTFMPSSLKDGVVEVEALLREPKFRNGVFEVELDGALFPLEGLTTKEANAAVRITGTCNLSHLIPKTASEQRDYKFSLRYTCDGEALSSNPSTISFWPPERRRLAIGGFLAPDSAGAEIVGDFLIVEGWAAKAGCSIESVEFQIQERKFFCDRINTPTPTVGASLPSLREALHGGFSLVLTNEQVGWVETSQFELTARITFSDKSQLELPHRGILWSGLTITQVLKGRTRSALFVSNNLSGVEGAPKVIFQVISIAREEGWDCKVIAPKGGELEKPLKELGVEVCVVEELYLAHTKKRDDFARKTERALAEFDRFQPQFVFGNTIEAFWAIRHAQALGLRNAWLIHESVDPRSAFPELDSTIRGLFLTTLRRTERALFVSDQTRELFGKFIGESAVIPNGVAELTYTYTERLAVRAEKRAELELPDEVPLMINVGTLCKRKGQDFFVEVLSGLRHLPWVALLIGGRKDDFRGDLERRISELGLRARVRIIDETPDVATYYAASDIAVITSREESAPLVSLEALNWSLPIVSTDVFGLAEQLENSGAAMLSPPDNRELFSHHLERFLNDRELRERCGARGKMWVQKRFSLLAIRERYRTMFR